jgi:hypothetical protein
MATCKICGKPLSEPLSVKLKIGPVCRLNQKIDASKDNDLLTFKMRACYDYSVIDGVICIVDNDRGRSVTNDAENVIADLIADGIDVSRPIIYRDTQGVWDQLMVQLRIVNTLAIYVFTGFAPLSETERDDAITKAKMTTKRAA